MIFQSRFLAALLIVLTSVAGFTSAARSQDEVPPWADEIGQMTNFLACKGNPYALCYYSGPEQATQVRNGAPSMPCVVSPDGKSADCTCYAVTKEDQVNQTYNFVLIGSILDPKIREETIKTCGADGENCRNMKNLAICNMSKNMPGCTVAPVCSHLGSIANKTPPTLYPNTKAELISTFSFAYAADHPFGSTDCSATPGPYAGCMTAPCTTDPNGTTTCKCPIYNGPYQVGLRLNKLLPLSCDISPNVWSAAENPGN